MVRGQKRKAKDDGPNDSIIDEVQSISGSSGLPTKNVKSATMTHIHCLPEGWSRKTVVRKTGKTAGMIDVYFFAPNGTKLRSKPDVKSYLERNKLKLKIEDFDFSKKLEEQKSVVATKKAPNTKVRKVNTAEEIVEAPTKESEENGKKTKDANKEPSEKKSKKDKNVMPKKVVKEVVQITAFKKRRTKK